MGLEMTELVMDCEDEFGIFIPDADAARVRTVGELHDLVLALTRDGGKPQLRQRPDLEQYAWDRVCALCTRGAPCMTEEDATTIARSTRFIEDLGYG